MEKEFYLKDFYRQFVIKSNKGGGWTDTTHSTVRVEIDHMHDTIEIAPVSGRDMYEDELFLILQLVLEEYEEEYGKKIKEYTRKSMYRFTYMLNGGKCEDKYIEYIKDSKEFPERKKLFHVSGYGKVGALKCFLYDLLDYAVARGDIEVQNGEYVPADTTPDDETAEIYVILPRDIDKESGWTWPYGPKEKNRCMKIVPQCGMVKIPGEDTHKERYSACYRKIKIEEESEEGEEE